MAIFQVNPVPECHHSGVYWSKGDEGSVTTVAIRRVKLQSNRHQQHTYKELQTEAC